METYIKKIDAYGIHGRFDIHQEFTEGINIIFGKNGAGKTTLLHILANALSSDYERFKELNFHSIHIFLSDGKEIKIFSKKHEKRASIEVKLNEKKIFPPQPAKKGEDITINDREINDILKYGFLNNEEISEQTKKLVIEEYLLKTKLGKDFEPLIPVAYFPAFRTMIEAWFASESKRDIEQHRKATYLERNSWKVIATEKARGWFGNFTPMINFPSLIEIEEKLTMEIEQARSMIWRTDQSLLSDAFLKTFEALSSKSKSKENLENLLTTIQKLFSQLEQSPLSNESRIDYLRLKELISKIDIKDNTENAVLRVLKVYRNILESSLTNQFKSFEGIRNYLLSVNEFFDGKSLKFDSGISLPPARRNPIVIEFDDGSYAPGLRALSSGERQILTLVYAATHMSEQQIVLIDEPEISLHVDWQRMLIKRMVEQVGNRQIIACTHSPVIGADHLENMSELHSIPTEFKREKLDDEEEIPF